MRFKLVIAILLLGSVAQAREPKHYQSGKLQRMESVKCGSDEKNGKSVTGELIGTDSSHMKVHELLCQEYVLETATLVYKIRPKEEKVEDLDDKEREYIVVSMVPRDSEDSTAASASAPRTGGK